jgi:hypothetical protein
MGGCNGGRARILPKRAPKEISRQQQADNLLIAIREALHELYDACHYGAEAGRLFPLGVDDLSRVESPVPSGTAQP